MICSFSQLIYPKDLKEVETGSYMVALYNPCEKVVDGAGMEQKSIKAVGYSLPTADNLRFNLIGNWSSGKHGVQYEVETYEEVIAHTKEGIIAYLSSGQIKGIGQKTAEKIFDALGMDTLSVLDNEPEKLLQVNGISEGKLEKIIDSYVANRGARDIVAFLVPQGITVNKAVKFYREYGNTAMDMVKNHPYQLCEIDGIGFRIADKVAQNLGVSRLSPERVDQGILFTLKEAEANGHLCINMNIFVSECMKVLETEGLTKQMIGVRATRMVNSGVLAIYNDHVYRRKMDEIEDRVAWNVKRLLKQSKDFSIKDLDRHIEELEKKMKLSFAQEQKEAVKMALTNGLSVITGGPGTGKTMIQQAILNIYEKVNQGKAIACCAPTGQAASRMEQSTGRAAATIHRTLNLGINKEDMDEEEENFAADFIIVDELSMVDIYLACALFEAIQNGSQVVLVGDVDQLPSVGPGAVLRELINCGCIPVVCLEQVFRQEEGSRIAANAKLIKQGQTKLDYGEDFQFIASSDIEQSAEILKTLYAQEVKQCGIDQVALLSPFRKKTATGVNAMNTQLQAQINPEDEDKKQVTYKDMIFREQDKVMQIKNTDAASNGDVGYIQRIYTSDMETEIEITFANNMTQKYPISDLELLDLGYASTVHKSQGSEYATVIINLQNAHYVMLNRALIYTAVTRGKRKVIIVGDKRALSMAIKTIDTQKRATNLRKRIIEYMRM